MFICVARDQTEKHQKDKNRTGFVKSRVRVRLWPKILFSFYYAFQQLPKINYTLLKLTNT